MQKVKAIDVTRFVVDCVMAAGSPRKPAEQLAALLLEADKCGHRSHGINRLKRYILDIKAGRCNPSNTPKILKQTAATAWVDGNNVLGATAANFCTDLALQKAKDAGIACVSVKGSNHFGIGGYWSKKLADNGMIGMTFSNSSPLVAPTRSTEAALGTNPLAVVAPGLPTTGPFYLDISMATVALGKIEMRRRAGEKLERGWAQGPDGKETLDPDVAIKGGSLLPLGGSEKSSGYKGFGLAALVDMLSGVLSGARYGHHVPRWSPTTETIADIGQTFIAINHKCFATGFEDRVSDSILHWRNLKPADPKFPVMAPGDGEKKALAEANSTGEVYYIPAILDSCDRLAKSLKVKPIKRIEVWEYNTFQMIIGPTSRYDAVVNFQKGLVQQLRNLTVFQKPGVNELTIVSPLQSEQVVGVSSVFNMINNTISRTVS